MLHTGNTLGNRDPIQAAPRGDALPQWLIYNRDSAEDTDLIVSARDTGEARRIYWAFIAANDWDTKPGDRLTIFRIPALIISETGAPVAHAWQPVERD